LYPKLCVSQFLKNYYKEYFAKFIVNNNYFYNQWKIKIINFISTVNKSDHYQFHWHQVITFRNYNQKTCKYSFPKTYDASKSCKWEVLAGKSTVDGINIVRKRLVQLKMNKKGWHNKQWHKFCRRWREGQLVLIANQDKQSTEDQNQSSCTRRLMQTNKSYTPLDINESCKWVYHGHTEVNNSTYVGRTAPFLNAYKIIHVLH